MTGELKACAERIERLKDAEAPFRTRGHDVIAGRCEVGIGAYLGSPDPSAKLVKLRQAKPVGPIDDKCIGARNIKSAFHDGSGKEHIVLPLIERRHDVFEFGWRHLAVGNHEADLRNIVPKERLEAIEILDARGHEECLSAAIFLSQECFAYRDSVKFGDVSPHRKPVDRRRGNNRQIANARECHLEGSRNRRR